MHMRRQRPESLLEIRELPVEQRLVRTLTDRFSRGYSR